MRIHTLRKLTNIIVYADDEFGTRVSVHAYLWPRRGMNTLVHFHGEPSVLDVLRQARSLVTEGMADWRGEMRHPTYQTGKGRHGLYWHGNRPPTVFVRAFRKRARSGITIEAIKAIMNEAVAALERPDTHPMLTQTEEFEMMGWA